jgi:hypothetical protein
VGLTFSPSRRQRPSLLAGPERQPEQGDVSWQNLERSSRGEEDVDKDMEDGEAVDLCRTQGLSLTRGWNVKLAQEGEATQAALGNIASGI